MRELRDIEQQVNEEVRLNTEPKQTDITDTLWLPARCVFGAISRHNVRG